MFEKESEINLFADDSVYYRQIEDTPKLKRILINWENGPGNGVWDLSLWNVTWRSLLGSG